MLHEAEPTAGPRILITQNDVRAIQLAKAALYAGVRLLMDQLGDRRPSTRSGLAGAFGSQIDPLHAMVLGLVPDCDLDQRARGRQRRRDRAPSSRCCRAPPGREIEGVVRRVEKIETAVEPRFQEHFVEAMAIPHRTAANPNLERVVTLPPRPATADRGADPRAERRRRRRRAGGRHRAARERTDDRDVAAPAAPGVAKVGGPRA